jgi:NADH:ubiquinone oxidoreductase subunit 6 (subunit J)
MEQSLNLLVAWAQANVEPIVFYLLAIAAIPLAYGVVMDRAIIRSGFLLIGVFGAISGIFLLLQAQFLALAQIMIYGVGITLVVVIALMLTNPRQEKDASPIIQAHAGPAAFVSVLVFVAVYLALRSAENWPLKPDVPMAGGAFNVKVLGASLMTWYSLPFEFASILLLAALIGAVMLAKAEPAEVKGAVSAGDEDNKLTSERTDDVVKV